MFKSLILSKFKKQKEALSIPYKAIASRAGVGVVTVKRAFSGHEIFGISIRNKLAYDSWIKVSYYKLLTLLRYSVMKCTIKVW
jgi:hypothetical protein